VEVRQDVRFHVRRLELEAIHVNAFEMIYPFDVTDLRGHSFVFFSCARARVCVSTISLFAPLASSRRVFLRL
jgi:hypothetical protein